MEIKISHALILAKINLLIPCLATQLALKMSILKIWFHRKKAPTHSENLNFKDDKKIQNFASKSVLEQHLTKEKTDKLQPNISNLVLDICAGITFAFFINQYITLNEFVRSFITWRDQTEAFLNELLEWLTGAPAGLKLNHEMTVFCGRFFLYHIYIWLGYLSIMEPYYGVIIHSITYSSCLGLSVMLAFASDILSFLAFHSFCFYVYAAKVFDLQLRGLISLSRLFRGKKWNPLRNRVDTISYDTDQLAFGTILFTVLLFLLPTTAIYYLVFALLRLPVLIVKAVLHCVIAMLNTFPVDGVIQRFNGSQIESDYIVLRVQYGELAEHEGSS